MIYLPIAEMSANIVILMALGGVVGFLSGIFGVGGGFLMTPMLIFLGIPAPVAVASGLNQILASSVSAVLPHYQRGNVDYLMAGILLAGGLVGSAIGTVIFYLIRQAGQIDLFVTVTYILFLTIIGGIMGRESIASLRTNRASVKRRRRHNFMHGWPNKLRFRKSNLYISIYPPIIIGFFIGILTAIMGVGGGFLMIPAMIYLLGMPTMMVIGTSLLQIIFVAAFATFLQAVLNQTVDIVLSAILIVGGVIGAQIGSQLAPRFRGEELRLWFSILVIGLGVSLLVSLFIPPSDPFIVTLSMGVK